MTSETLERAAAAAPPDAGPSSGHRQVVTWVFVAAVAVVSVLLRIPSVGLSAFPDEAGYLLVAHDWHGGGPGPYGDLWVDRPPVLLAFWRLADAWGGIVAARWMACALVAALVVISGRTGMLLGGPRGARWSAVVAAALATSPMLGAREVNGELLAIPLVMVSCLATMLSLRPPHESSRRAWWAVLAGTTGVLAVLVKQNFVDSLVFATVLVLMLGVRGVIGRRAAVRALGFGVVGAVIPVLAVLAWVEAAGIGVGELWYTLYGFRSDAARVIWNHSLGAPEHRAIQLAGLAIGSGVLMLIVAFVWGQRRRLRHGVPVVVAIGVMLLVGVVGVATGGSYWAHYLLGLVPALVLSVGHLAGTVRGRRAPRVLIGFVVASSLIATVSTAFHGLPGARKTTAVASALRQSAGPGDSGFVAYGHPNVLQEAGLDPAYRYLWSLPMRTRDPDLDGVVATLDSASAPAWFVQWEPLNSWNIDRDGRLRATLERQYRLVADVCGASIYLRRGAQRTEPASVSAC